ncbi:hypothetical protein EYF80_011844 [Liparis tanakae]|uniref:Uncharacterized protein n=1 Tax=Liparis tanakae TaxID=230148 RepID=A0A4Z2IJI4_9TELE|nr:hypothetical protein EYF80_011844 [Liparis tanakae]
MADVVGVRVGYNALQHGQHSVHVERLKSLLLSVTLLKHNCFRFMGMIPPRGLKKKKQYGKEGRPGRERGQQKEDQALLEAARKHELAALPHRGGIKRSPGGCVHRTPLFTLYTLDCYFKHEENSVVKFQENHQGVLKRVHEIVAAVPSLASAAGWLTIRQLLSLIGNQSAADAAGIKGAELEGEEREQMRLLCVK